MSSSFFVIQTRMALVCDDDEGRNSYSCARKTSGAFVENSN
jgi:hypothetical protein